MTGIAGVNRDDEPGTGDLMHGGCYALALHLHRRTGFALHGLFGTADDPEDAMEHAFVVDPGSGLAYDARGASPVGEVAKPFRGRPPAGTFARPVSAAAVRRLERCARREWPSRALRRFCLAEPDLSQVV